MSAEPSPPPAPIALLAATGFVAMALMRVTDTLLPAIASDLSAEIATTAAIVTAYSISYGAAQVVYGPLGDRAGKLRVIGIALAVGGVLTLGCAAANGVTTLAVLRFATGLAMAACVPLSLALIGDLVPYAARQATIGRILSAVTLGQVMGGAVAGVIAEFFGWRWVFVGLGAAALVIAWPLARAARAWPARAPRAPASRLAFGGYLALLKRRGPRLLVYAVFIEGFFFYGALAYTGAFLQQRFGMSYLAIGGILAAFGFGGLIYSVSVVWLVRRLGERRMILAGALMVGASYAAFGLAPGWEVATAALFVGGFFFYMLHNTFQTLATELAPESRGVAVSLFVFTIFLGTALGVAILGRLVAHGGYAALFVVAGAGIGALGLWFQSRVEIVKGRA
jgi:predicted MFS family arabinose efflux permease